MTQSVAHVLLTPEHILDPLMLQLSRLIGIQDPTPYNRVSIIPFQPLKDGKAAGDHQCVVTLMDHNMTRSMWAGLVPTEPLVQCLAAIPAGQGPVGVDTIIDKVGEAIRNQTLKLEPNDVAQKVVSRAQLAYQGDFLYHRITEAAWRTIDPSTTDFPQWAHAIPTGNLYHFARAETERVLGNDYEGVEFGTLVDDNEKHILILTFYPLPPEEDDGGEEGEEADAGSGKEAGEEAGAENPTGAEGHGGVEENTVPDRLTLAAGDAGDAGDGDTEEDGTGEGDSDNDDEDASDEDGEEGEGEEDEGEEDEGEEDEGDSELVQPVTYYFDALPYLGFIRGLDAGIGRESLLDAADDCGVDLPDETVAERMATINNARILANNVMAWVNNDIVTAVFRSLKAGETMEAAAARGASHLCVAVGEIMMNPASIDTNAMLEAQGKMIWKSGVTDAAQYFKITRRKKIKQH